MTFGKIVSSISLLIVGLVGLLVSVCGGVMTITSLFDQHKQTMLMFTLLACFAGAVVARVSYREWKLLHFLQADSSDGQS